jgi:hypothetical protein
VVVYRFEEIDASLTLVPLAGRRALDRAGRKVGLEAWQRLPIEVRATIIDAGSGESVDEALVRKLVDAIPWTEHEAWPEPPRDVVDHEVIRAGLEHPIAVERWSALRALDRWAITSLARRGRHEGLTALRRELGV